MKSALDSAHVLLEHVKLREKLCLFNYFAVCCVSDVAWSTAFS